MLDADAICKVLPHRYPFLLVDRVIELAPGQRAVGLKNVTINEPFFAGHFPGRPVMPGVLIVEAMAQLGAIALLAVPENRGKLGLLAGLDRVRFRRMVKPGDSLRLQIEVLQRRGSMGRAAGTAEVDGQVAATAEILFALVDGSQETPS
ncbi:MAG TPA: 3-hydroxyacyl-[acyl-carrier-protein] dehydratase FabZ [Clostridiales bacterium]|nr:3-hydroxyacyl-[acyl-carrier-protein] dehydratase FabZ [Clostridiales bacterium]